MFILLLFSLFVLFASPISAHTGSGPPFVTINAKFANTNPYSLAQEDIAPENYVVDQEIYFAIDINALSVPKDIAQKSKFRWKFSKDESLYQEGTTVSHSYSKPKSYFVDLEVLPPGSQNYIALDTILIHVLPASNYKLSVIKLHVETDSLSSNSPLRLTSDIKTDPSSTITAYAWNFNDGEKSAEKEPTHAFAGKDYFYLVTLRVIDSNGFIADKGLIASASNGKLDIGNPFDQNEKVEVELGKQNRQNQQDSKNSFPFPPWYFFVLLTSLTAVIVYFAKRRVR